METKYKKAWKSLLFSQNQKDLDLPVLSGSMDPLIQKGDIIRIRPCKASSLHIGHIAVFRSRNKIFAHRVLLKWAIGSTIWILEKGDRNIIPRWIQKQNILGKVIEVHKNSKTYSLDNPMNRKIQRTLSRKQLVLSIFKILLKPARFFKILIRSL